MGLETTWLCGASQLFWVRSFENHSEPPPKIATPGFECWRDKEKSMLTMEENLSFFDVIEFLCDMKAWVYGIVGIAAMLRFKRRY